MVLNKKEKKQYKQWIRHESKYRDSKGRWQKGVTIGDIRRDSGHSNDRETVDVSIEITKEEK